MGTWTLYSAGGDLTLLGAIFNGVAMICTQISLIWGFAMLASMWLLTRSLAGSALQGPGSGGAVLSQGSIGAFVPLILAMLLTMPGALCKLNIQNNSTGVVTTVDNVPFVIAAIPVAGSIMATNIGTQVTAAFSNVNASYDVISAAGNGFLDPMKRLLGARSAIQRLGAIDTEIKIIMNQCIGPDAGTDFTVLNNMVLNAGNSGATSTQSVSIGGSDTSGIGALLYQAAQNKLGMVPQIAINNTTIVNCADAVAMAVNDINALLASAEFTRVIQGAVNGMDQPQSGADFSLTQLQSEFSTLRKWNSVGATLAAGTTQANDEVMNFLFAEEVNNSLNCAQAQSSDKANCEAALVQATELERNNIQAAANEVPMLQYAGSFGNYILALVIGLGPVIVMFMMFAGVAAGKCIKTAVHIVVWPLLVTNVGAELVNAMISMQFSNFMASVAQAGALSPASMQSIYKELSLQVGVGSHIMASLPVLMSMIFALGETASLVSVAKEVQPQGREVGQDVTPSPVAAAPLARMSAPMTVQQGLGFADIKATGATDAVSSSASYGQISRDTSKSVNEADAREQRESQERTVVRRTADALARRDYHSLGLTWTQGESLRKELGNSLRSGEGTGSDTSVSSNHLTQTGSQIGISGSAGVKFGVVPDVGGGVNASASSAASDQDSLASTVKKSSDVNLAKALSKTLSSDTGKQIRSDQGRDGSHSLNAEKSAADSYVESTTHRASDTTNYGEALKSSSSFLEASQNIHAPEIANYMVGSGDFRHFQRMEGMRFDANPATARYKEQAERDMANMNTDSINGNPAAREAVLRHAAAVNMTRDTKLPEAERFGALKYLAAESNAMLHSNFSAPGEKELKSGQRPIALPKNTTGVSGGALMRNTEAALSGERGFRLPKFNLDPARTAELEKMGNPSRLVDGALPTLEAPSATGGTAAEYTARLAEANAHGLGNGPDGRGTVNRALVNAGSTLIGYGQDTVERLLDISGIKPDDAPPKADSKLPLVDPFLDPTK